LRDPPGCSSGAGGSANLTPELCRSLRATILAHAVVTKSVQLKVEGA
jgi:hypothetical protein